MAYDAETLRKIVNMSNNQDAVKLLPCPFCGAAAKLEQGGFGEQFAACTRCWLHMGMAWADTKENAVKGWNTRAPTPREQELEARCRELEAATLTEWKKRERLSQYPRGKTVCPTKALGDLAYMVDKLEAQNKALWELVSEYAECEVYSPLDKKAKRLLAARQKQKESVE